MRTYKQLTYEQRCQIEALKKSGMSQSEMARIIGVKQPSISRELSRNKGLRGYHHKQAHHQALKRREEKRKWHKMTEELIDEIEDKLYEKWSPEQISGWLLQDQDVRISHERIYQYIWKDKQSGGDLYKNLRRHGRAYHSRGKDGKSSRGQIKNRVSIDLRPESVEDRIEVGDWEVDLVIGKKHSGALVTIVERVTGFTLSERVNSKRAEEVACVMLALLIPYKKWVRTITSDNGKEFADHERIASELNCDFYFAHPYSSWERGTNENTNGLLRQYFPKNTDLKKVSDEAVTAAVEQLNNRPRKRLAFQSPAVLMQYEMAA